MCYDLLRFSLCSSICAMACKLRCYISCLLVVALSPPPQTAPSSTKQNPHSYHRIGKQTPTSSLLEARRKSIYLYRVYASIVFRVDISGLLYNNQSYYKSGGPCKSGGLSPEVGVSWWETWPYVSNVPYVFPYVPIFFGLGVFFGLGKFFIFFCLGSWGSMVARLS